MSNVGPKQSAALSLERQQEILRSDVDVLDITFEKTNTLSRLAKKAKKNLRRRVKELYEKNMLATDRDKIDHDEAFIKQAEKRVDELVKIIWKEISDARNRETYFNGEPGDEVAALFYLATVQDLGHLLDVNNSFSIAGFIEEGEFDMNREKDRASAIDEIIKDGCLGYKTEYYSQKLPT